MQDFFQPKLQFVASIHSHRTQYFGVVTAREYIKIKGERVPFWNFLDVLPDGWLTSLAYKHVAMPADRQQIWDCGAWSYKNEDQPNLGGTRVTPEWALEQYAAHAVAGAMTIAPDHLLIPGVAVDKRRQFNEQSARAFLEPARSAGFRPMAAIHGMDADERLAHAHRLLDMGYDALAVGGVAARASQRQHVIEMVHALREETRGAWLHVLGLSAPSYMEAWQGMGVDSCDGSSHFKQAFTGGAFYVHETGRLVRYHAAKVDRETGSLLTDPIPYLCFCKACQALREEGVDTRTYGSNENNMGRAAHNLNMLLRAHQHVSMQQVYLVSCVGKKGLQPATAALLYESAWFQKARRFVEGREAPWHILSAAYGLVHPDQRIAPYDLSLNQTDSVGRALWAERVAEDLKCRYTEPTRFVLLAGNAYREHLVPRLEAAGHAVEVPMRGMGIGQQLSWLDRQDDRQLPLFETME